MLEGLHARACWSLCLVIVVSACGTSGALALANDSVSYLDVVNPTVVQPIEPTDRIQEGNKFVQVEVVEVENPKAYPATLTVDYQTKAHEKTVVVESSPRRNLQQDIRAQQPWFYCQNPQGYYPLRQGVSGRLEDLWCSRPRWPCRPPRPGWPRRRSPPRGPRPRDIISLLGRRPPEEPDAGRPRSRWHSHARHRRATLSTRAWYPALYSSTEF
jgi:hypothetical protein